MRSLPDRAPAYPALAATPSFAAEPSTLSSLDDLALLGLLLGRCLSAPMVGATAEALVDRFGSATDPSKPVSHGTLYSFMWRQRDRGVIPYVTNRDLRRTFKTLAGKAGVSKEIRDRLQNHALQDVSSKNYDRWNYMPEKRAGMAKWDKFVRAMLAKKKGTGALKKAA